MATAPFTRQEGDAHHNVIITVEDKAVVFANLLLNEGLADTNSFSFIWKNELNDSFTDDQKEFIEKYIGKKVVISFDDTYSFKGIILEISYFQNDGLTQEFNIGGQGMPVLLNDQAHSASYYKKTLKNIINDSVKGIPANELALEADPKMTVPLHYVVQYNETDFNFIRNLAIRAGEWFFYNGEKLIFGKLPSDQLELRNGVDITNAKVSSSLKPYLNSAASYDEFKGEEISVSGIKPSASGILQSLFSSSEQTFGRSTEKLAHPHQAPTEALLRSGFEMDVDGKIARMLKFSAQSFNAKIRLGLKIKVIERNDHYNEYIVVQINHRISTRDAYENSFLAVPSSVRVPPYTNPRWYPRCETQTAIVKENEDTDGHDRVRVHFPWQAKTEMTPWIRIQNPYAGKDKGFRFVPEKKEEVIVGFEEGNAERPYVIGAMFNGASKSGHNREGNHIKVFRTVAGCRLMMNDQDGSVKIVDKAGSFIKLDGSGNIAISASGDLKIQIGGNSDIQIGKDSTYIVGGKFDESIGADKTLTVGANEEKTIGQDSSITVAMNLTVVAGQNIETTAGMDLALTAGMKLTENAGTEVGIEGVAVSIKGSAMAEMASPMTTVKGDAVTTIKGGMVMIN